MPLWKKAEEIMYEDQPYTFLFRRKTLAFYDKRIKNVKMTKLGINSRNSDSPIPLEQYVPIEMQRHTR